LAELDYYLEYVVSGYNWSLVIVISAGGFIQLPADQYVNAGSDVTGINLC